MSEREKITLALIASAFLHVIGGAFLVIWMRTHPGDFSKAVPDLEQLEVTLVAAPTPVLMNPPPAQKIERSLLDTDGLQASEKAPEHARFESSINSRAASENPATGNLPLPSQQGRNLPFANFKSQDSSMGPGKQTTAASAPQPARAAPAETRAETSAVPPPAAELKGQTQSEQAEPRPTPFFNPTPAPVATPTPRDAFAIGKMTPVPTGTPRVAEAPPTLATPTPEQLAKLVPAPLLRANPEANQPASEPGSQAFKEKTQIEGGITNRGRAGVDAIQTPRGKYEAVMHALVGSRWSQFVKKNGGLISAGEVTVSFTIDQQGHTSDVKVISNTANAELANITIRAILESRLPPVPEELAPMLRNGRLEIPSARFNCYELNQ